MRWFVYCVDCENKISVDGVDWKSTETICLTCMECNKSHAYKWTDRRTTVKKIFVFRYRIYNSKLYLERKIMVAAIAMMVFSIIFPAFDIRHLPLEMLVSVFLAFVAWQLGSGRVKIEYTDENALKSIKVKF